MLVELGKNCIRLTSQNNVEKLAIIIKLLSLQTFMAHETNTFYTSCTCEFTQPTSKPDAEYYKVSPDTVFQFVNVNWKLLFQIA